ncbi:hypothetical protein EJ573_02990 [Paenibacillus polymyxa]|uniref:hypothetical protein n=1 Tax=Paenibacillus polymyxa TaxID=1406 RepID=UPI000F87CFEC|nr:hypothetical protein [Paenibacillus polymyxa]RTZ38183.1 hypothetical protein EJ573_02990 [Paenibacillus polymyxa]
MTDKHYVDAVKLIGHMNAQKKQLREELNFAKREGETAWADDLRSKMEIYSDLIEKVGVGKFDPDPPQQPDIKLWSKVKHKHHPSWGIGIFQEFSKKKDKALILWPDRKGMFGDRVIGYCQVEKLHKVEGEEV